MTTSAGTGTRSASRARRRRGALVLSLGMAVAPVLVVLACGGTTGSNLPPGSGGLPGTDGGVDATVSAEAGEQAALDAGLFDVTIEYADRVLPDVAAPVEGGQTVAAAYPNCPPFIRVGHGGMPLPPSQLQGEKEQLPSTYGDDGSVVPAPDGSVCATYPWLGSTAIDQCATQSQPWPIPILPACNWCADAGLAVAGPMMSFSRYDNCMALYSCAVKNCAGKDPGYCLCGAFDSGICNQAAGPCGPQEMAALEQTSVMQALFHFTDDTPDYPVTQQGICGGTLNLVLYQAFVNGCYAQDDGGGD